MPKEFSGNPECDSLKIAQCLDQVGGVTTTLAQILTQQILLRDILLFILTNGNPFDREIVEILTSKPEPNKPPRQLTEAHWRHIFDEAGRLSSLPEQHAEALNKLYAQFEAGQLTRARSGNRNVANT